MKSVFEKALTAPVRERGYELKPKAVNRKGKIGTNGGSYEIGHGAVVIAAITSCTNTSNPSVMVAAGLVAKKAVEKGLSVKPYVKTSLAPGSRVVTDYLKQANLLKPLSKLGFNVVGYGCTTCIGNSGPLPGEVAKAITGSDLVAAAVISGNRNFEGRVHPLVKATWHHHRWSSPTPSPVPWTSTCPASRLAWARTGQSISRMSGRRHRKCPKLCFRASALACSPISMPACSKVRTCGKISR
jgi:hypothetical protein